MVEFVKVQNLKTGDILAKTIYNDNLKVLLKEGNALTPTGINAISKLAIKGVYIEHDSNLRRESVPLAEPLLDDDDMIIFIQSIRQMFLNQKPFTDTYDSTFKVMRNTLEEMVRRIVHHLKELYDADSLLYETEDYGRTVNNWIYHHTMNTVLITIGICFYLGYDTKTTEDIAIGALYHDYGKAEFGEALYNKEDITDSDKMMLRKHPEIMFRLLQRLGYPVTTTYAVWQHHEKSNGSGYPHGIDCNKITMAGQIVGLASAFDNLVTMQAYNRNPMTPSDALEYLQGCNEYSIDCMLAMFNFITPYPIGSKVLLSDGNIGLVLKNTKGLVLRPYVVTSNSLYDLAYDKSKMNVTIVKVLEN